MNPKLLLELRQRVEEAARSKHRGIRVLPKPRFRKFVLGVLSYADLQLMARYLTESGYPTWIDIAMPRDRTQPPHFQLLSNALDLHVTDVGHEHYVTVGDDLRLDAQVDVLFLALMERHPTLRSRCSDCYAHFTPPGYLLDAVRPSAACEHSHALHPIALTYPGNKLEVSLFT